MRTDGRLPSTACRASADLAVAREPPWLSVLVVDNRSLHQDVADLLGANGGNDDGDDGAQLAWGASEVMRLVGAQRFDLVLIDVDHSVLEGMTTAARIRGIERGQARPDRPPMPLVACASHESSYRDCLFAGSGLSGALKMPWTTASVAACLEHWCAGKFPPLHVVLR